jgi:benzoate membrane transport protein
MRKQFFTLSHISAGFAAVLVGYTSSVVIIIQAASSAGANASQIESWLLTLGICMGVSSIFYSWFYKMPVLMAWSTPGAAMLVGAVSLYTLPTAIGAFILTGGLITLTGLISPLSRLIERIPTPLSTAMLGAILLPFCLKAFMPLQSNPTIFLGMLACYLAAKRFIPQYTMLILLIAGIVAATLSGAFVDQNIEVVLAKPIWVAPEFDWHAMINLSIPLYVITMLSQNLPGIAMMRSYDYHAPVKPILIGTGITNMLCAPFGGFSVNLAAISAAICMNHDVDADESQRYRAAIWAGVFYLIAGMWATTVVNVFLALPNEISHILAGLALLGTLMMCLQNAFNDNAFRESALFTFLITLSGISFLGINSLLWGLLIGLVHLKWINNKIK